MTGHWKFCDLMAFSDIFNRNLCMIKAAAFAQGQIVQCLKEPRHRFLVSAYPFRLAARCQKGLLYQVLRKMPVPYATICKPDHSIRVLKHQMMDVLSLLLIHTIPSFAKSHQKISCHAINSRQLIYLNWWLSPCSIIVLHTDRHNLTCSGAASFNMLANSTEILTSG